MNILILYIIISYLLLLPIYITTGTRTLECLRSSLGCCSLSTPFLTWDWFYLEGIWWIDWGIVLED